MGIELLIIGALFGGFVGHDLGKNEVDNTCERRVASCNSAMENLVQQNVELAHEIAACEKDIKEEG